MSRGRGRPRTGPSREGAPDIWRGTVSAKSVPYYTWRREGPKTRRKVRSYSVSPWVKIQGKKLAGAGFVHGDTYQITAPKPGVLVLIKEPGEEGACGKCGAKVPPPLVPREGWHSGHHYLMVGDQFTLYRVRCERCMPVVTAGQS